MTAFDRRLTPARADLAAAHLEGLLPAPRYAAGVRRRVTAASAPLRGEPRPDAPLDTEALAGEIVTVYEESEGFAWGQLETDGYVGYLPSAALGDPGAEPTHRVAALRSFVFPGPSIKLPPLAWLSIGASVSTVRSEGIFAVLADGGYVFAGHLAPLESRERDFVAVADRFLGAPYLWGGRTSLGLDCSALVQLSVAATGVSAPRDSDLQEASLGAEVPLAAIGAAGEGLGRGDLLFWKGHVAVARGDGTIVHANGHHMAVVIEPAAEAIARIAASGIPLRSVRRLGG